MKVLEGGVETNGTKNTVTLSRAAEKWSAACIFLIISILSFGELYLDFIIRGHVFACEPWVRSDICNVGSSVRLKANHASD